MCAVKRGNDKTLFQVSFDAFNRTFTLSLMPSPEILTPGFKAYTQSGSAVEEVEVDKTSILTVSFTTYIYLNSH